ncbi:MAG: hypothetical protein V1740_06385 [Candidatus Woesearchaeota archaeon]
MKKRGMMEVQFNWIFILFVGALIILFFTKVIYNQKVIADRKLSVEILDQLTLLSTGAEVATSTASEIDLSRNSIGFECDECNCRYYVRNLGEKDFEYINKRALFAPSIVEGEKILTWALDWNMPYKVSNFLFITSPEIRYVFIYGSPPIPDELQEIMDKLPEQINVGNEGGGRGGVLNYINDFEYQNEYLVKIILYDNIGDYSTQSEVNTALGSLLNNQLKDVEEWRISLIRVDPEPSATPGRLSYVGKIDFYKVEDGQFVEDGESKTHYLGDTSLIGAILVDNYDAYVCPMESAFQRLNYVSAVYRGRTIDLSTQIAGNQKCEATYEDAIQFINEIETKSQSFFRSFGPNDSAMSYIYERAFSVGKLEDLNDRIILFSCPEIF